MDTNGSQRHVKLNQAESSPINPTQTLSFGVQGANTEFGASATVCSGLVRTGRTPITIPKVHDAGPVPGLHAVVRVRVSVIRVRVRL